MTDKRLAKRITSRSPIHFVLLADDSQSMCNADAEGVTRAAAATKAMQAWIAELYMLTRGAKPYFRFTLISFGNEAVIEGENYDVRDIDIQTFVLDGTSGTTNMAAAFDAAGQVLQRDGHTPEWCAPFVFMFTDGYPTSQATGKVTPEARAEAVSAAKRLKELKLACGSPYIVALGFGEADAALLKEVASEGMSKMLASARELLRVLPSVGTPTVRGGGDDFVVGDMVNDIREI